MTQGPGQTAGALRCAYWVGCPLPGQVSRLPGF